MDSILKFALVFVGSGLVSFALVKVVIAIAKRYNILDYPQDDRKIHSRPLPLLGGVAIYLSVLLTVAVLWQSNQLLDPRMSGMMIIWFLLAGLILVINGALDDKYTLAPYISIWGPILASLAVIMGGLKIAYITNPAGGVLYLDTWLSALPGGSDLLIFALTFLWLMGITYTTKLLDGIDGLTPSIGLVGSIVIFIISLSWDVVGSTTSLLALSLGGATLGFLIWNWHPAKIFLGEGGSTFIGFSLGVLAIISGSKIATALLVMGFPLLDIIWVIIRRIKNKQPIWKGDREHLHFRLLRAGLGQKQIVIFLSIISLSFGLVSIFFTSKTKIGALLILIVLMFVVSTWLNYKLKRIEQNIN